MQNLGRLLERIASALKLFCWSCLQSKLSLFIFRYLFFLLASSQDSLGTEPDSIELVEDVLACLYQKDNSVPEKKEKSFVWLTLSVVTWSTLHTVSLCFSKLVIPSR